MDKKEIQNLIKELIEKTTIPVNEITITEDSPTNCWFAVEVQEPHFFTSREGEALIAINGFQKKKVENLRAVAHMMAERERYFKSNIEVDPMPAFERRIVHEFLSDAIDLKTESMGEGPSRRVVIKYTGSI